MDAASRGALIAAFLAVVVAGLSGAAIGYGLVGIGCTGDCSTVSGLGALVVGLITEVSVTIIPAEDKSVAAFVILVVVLLLRPEGIIAAARRG